jgi:tetratricopeptide (TPR) repeat protein
VVVPAVAKALEHDDPSVRSAAARQLGKLGHSQEALSLLLHHRSDSSMWVRGGVYSSLGAFRDPGALAALQEAERVEKDAQPRRDLAAALLEQSRYLLEAGRLEESREAAQSSLAIREETYWVDHPLVGESLAALARIDIEEGAYDAAEGNLRRAIATAGGAENPTTTDWWRDYGRALELRGDSQQALSIYLRVVENRERLQGPRGPAIVEALKDVARVLEATGDPEGAGKFRRRAVELQSATARY